MSKGPGLIERAIAAIFVEDDQEGSFTVAQLCERIYGLNEKKDCGRERSSPCQRGLQRRDAGSAMAGAPVRWRFACPTTLS
jgi:hypothetical protein